MRWALGLIAALLAGLAVPVGPTATAAPVGGSTCRVFPAENYWHADIRDLPVHPRSDQWLSHMHTDVDLHPDFGPSFGAGPSDGIPVTVVRHGPPRV